MSRIGATNRLCFNVGKTNIVGFGCDMRELQLDSDPLQEKSVTTFLGVVIDSELRFQDHILKLGRKLSSACFAVRTARMKLGPGIARTVYFALFESHLRYGISFWGLRSQYLLNVLFITQKKAIGF